MKDRKVVDPDVRGSEHCLKTEATVTWKRAISNVKMSGEPHKECEGQSSRNNTRSWQNC